MDSVFQRKLAAAGTLVLDGGLASELERRGCRLDPQLWSARALAEQPDAVVDVHLAYLRSGADCILSAGYQASVPGFRAAGFSAAAAERLCRDSVRLAFAARDALCRDRAIAPTGLDAPLVLASIGPYGAVRADGSEYRGGYSVDAPAVRELQAERIALAVDELRRWTDEPLLAFETVPSLDEARLLLELLQEHPGTRAWLGFSCRDGRTTAEGQSIEDCAAAVASHEALVALGINCVAPQLVSQLVPRFGAARQPVVAYPNAGGVYDAAAKAWIDERDAGTELPDLGAWVDAGARIIGGCCRTTPDWIARVARWRDAAV